MIELESFNAASDDVQTEADDLAAVVRDSYAFDAPGGTRIRSAIGTYVRLVLDKEWPLMRHGQESPAAWQSIDEVFGAMRAYTPVSASQSMFYEDSVRHLNAVLEARSDRVSASDGVIVGFSLVVLLSLQFPFSGNLAISSQPFKEGALAPFSARQS
jgi:hypothetical protein